jgi:hypothetical protein
MGMSLDPLLQCAVGLAARFVRGLCRIRRSCARGGRRSAAAGEQATGRQCRGEDPKTRLHEVQHPTPCGAVSAPSAWAWDKIPQRTLLLPGALLVAMLAELLAPFVFVDFRFATFF